MRTRYFFKQSPGERTCARTRRNTEVFAFEGRLTESVSFLLKKFRVEVWVHIGGCAQPNPRGILARPRSPERVGEAPRRGQHGEACVWSACAHRTQSGNQVGGQTRHFIGHDPSIDLQAAY